MLGEANKSKAPPQYTVENLPPMLQTSHVEWMLQMSLKSAEPLIEAGLFPCGIKIGRLRRWHKAEALEAAAKLEDFPVRNSDQTEFDFMKEKAESVETPQSKRAALRRPSAALQEKTNREVHSRNQKKVSQEEGDEKRIRENPS